MVKILNNKNKGKMIIAIVLMLTVLGSISYGAFFVYRNQTNDNVILSSCFSTTMTNESSSINLTKAIPMSDEEGKKSEPYTFTLTNTCDLTAEYYVIISSTTGSFSSDYIDYQYNDSEVLTLGEATINTLGKDNGYTDSFIIASGTLRQGRSVAYNIRIWLNEDADYSQIHGQSWSGQIKVISKASNKNYSERDIDFIAYVYDGTHTQNSFEDYIALLNQRNGYTVSTDCSSGTHAEISPSGKITITQISMPATCTVTFEDYIIDGSGANPPKLVDNLIPVVYNETSGKWVMSTTNAGEWYDYGEMKWANAVTVAGDKRGTYSVGDAIEISDILGMWVWIPRYEYKYTNLGNQYAGGSSASQPGKIDIKFVSGTSTTETSGYIIHPAFRNGSVTYTNNAYTTTSAYQMGGWDSEISGFWMGKFETSSAASASDTSSAILYDPIVKPNVVARRYQTVSAEFNTILNVKTYHGISTMDSHMSKNSEWGAVAYLSQSDYGKYGNSDYSGANKEVYMNNSSSFYTGRSMGLPSGATGNSTSAEGSYEYNVALNGTGASTTGNIYGIYDMAGGSWEYQMGWLNTVSSNFGYANKSGTDTNDAGFSSAPSNHRYYEEYTTATAATACGGSVCYGQALSETAGWYGDFQNMVSPTYPWFVRGASSYYSSNVEGGPFGSTGATGISNNEYGVRAVLV